MSRRHIRYGSSYYAFAHILCLFTILSSCNSIKFVGRSGRISSLEDKNEDAASESKQKAVSTTNANQQTEIKQDVPVDFNLKNFEQSLELKQKGSSSILESGDPSELKIITSSLPPGGKIDSSNLSVVWQSDVQDIGKSFSVDVTISNGDVEKSTSGLFKVNPPSVAQQQCSYIPEPVIGSIQPQEKFHWLGYSHTDGRTYSVTYSAPVVGDLDGDGLAEIVVIPSAKYPYYNDSYNNVNGPVIVLDGATGQVKWNSYVEGGFGLEVSASAVLLDLDNDGYAEIIGTQMIDAVKKRVVIIDYKTKSIKATYEENFKCATNCIIAAADVDGDGSAEIAAGNVLLNANGSRKAYLESAMEPYDGSMERANTTIADLDPSSPGLEIIVNGSRVFSSQGVQLWRGDCKGFSAVADLDMDGSPELVCIGSGKVNVFSKSGNSLWKENIPYVNPISNARGGAPNIGNFDSDPTHLEIGTAGGDYYIVYDYLGNELWKSPTDDHSSHGTGSTVFDFNGDGKVEVIYNDEKKLRIYDGETGAVLWDTANASGTLWEYPVIANIDNDSSVEIIVSAPGQPHKADDKSGGIRVFDDPTNRWVTSRNLWNQYNYYPEIVSDKLTVTATTGKPTAGFRVNSQGVIKSNDAVLLPDISIVTPLFPTSSTASQTVLSFLLMNKGQAVAPAGLTVDLYEEGSNDVIASTITSAAIDAGGWRVIQVTVPKALTKLRGYNLKVNMSSTGDLNERECNEDNSIDFELKSFSRFTE